MTDRTDTAYELLTQLRTDLSRLQDLQGIEPMRRGRGWAPSPDRIAAAGKAHLIERAETINQLARGLKPIGASPALIDLVVPSTLKDVTDELGDLQDAVLERHAPDIAPAATAPRRIGRIINLLHKIGTDDVLLDHVLAETRRMLGRVRYALGESEEVRQLATRCPHCGARSLHELPARGVVVCGNAACRCSDPDCRCHDEDRPRRHEWSALPEGISA
jgi:hypothetical protein